MAAPTEQLRVATDDSVQLAVTVTGEGPPLVMIPGLGATREIYLPLIEPLARCLRVVVYDPRGVGESDVAPPPYPMARLAADCVAVAGALGIDRFQLFGASMGGLTAEHVAVLHPERVSRLVLAATGPGRHPAALAAPEATAALLGRGAKTPADAYRMACTVLYSARFQREHPEFIEAEVARRARHPVAGRAFSAHFRSSREADISSRLGEIRVPALVLHGTRDVLVPVDNAELLVRLIPGARRYWFDGCGHLFFHEDPRLTTEVLLSFLDTGTSAAA